MKKIFAMLLVLFLLVVGFAGCGGGETPEPEMPVETETPETPDVQIEEQEEPEEELEEAEEDNPLLTASNEEIQQAVIDALNDADQTIFREVGSFRAEQYFISELLGVEPTVIFQMLNQGVRSGNRTTSVSIQRLDRLGNSVPSPWQRHVSEDIFSHWDFIYEVDDEGVLQLVMRHHFDFEADMSGITRENFDAIEIGMSLDDVSSLLGSEGTLGVTSGNHEIRTWSREFGMGTVIISIYFIDNQVTAKAQVGW